jgi:FtsP/CotA-like multicopper oxidase with cupredoxin domain
MQTRIGLPRLALQALPGGTLDPTTITKYVTPLVIPPVMPRTAALRMRGRPVVYYEIAVRQFDQQILPAGYPATTVWSYGSVNHAGTFNYPAFTIEAKYNQKVRVKWINDLKDPATGNFLPHLLPVDQTLHWANPPGGLAGRDMRGMDPAPYEGPVPIITHVHGAHVADHSDGYPEAWYLPDAIGIPAGYATTGTWYDTFKTDFFSQFGVAWQPGTATFQYDNDQRATTLWYHDHSLGMTRENVYAGPAGFYLIRGGPDDLSLGYRAPKEQDLFSRGKPLYTEIPIVIQDRSFNADGSLFYPDNRAFFENLNQPPTVPFLDIPFIPDMACDGAMSDISPIWNPEFFGNTMVVNGDTWPFLNVEQRRYRFRFLNGCNSRFLILQNDNNLPFWQIGSEGGFLPAPVELTQLLIGPAERADVIVDFTGLPVGTTVILLNLGPDEPFGGGVPGVDFAPSDPLTTGQVMQFTVVPTTSADTSIAPAQMVLPAIVPLGASAVTRQLSLNEEDSATVRVVTDNDGNVVLDCVNGAPFGPMAAKLGTVEMGMPMPMMWMHPVSENPAPGAIETWEIYNFTMDGHPIHIHMVQFQVVNREDLVIDPDTGMPAMPVQLTGAITPPEAWETGFKDTVIALPGQVTRVKAQFDRAGLFVWHCHILEHEDNEMMRPYTVGPLKSPI